jgi:hypothetical protein
MIANATAMKLAALSTVNNRIQLDDVRKYRRARSQEGGAGSQQPISPAGLPHSNILMTNEHGQILTPEQAALLQQQQIAALQGRRSRPASPGIAITGPVGGMQPHFMQNNGFLTALNGNNHSAMAGLNAGLAGMNLGAYPNGAIGLGGFGSPGGLNGGGLSAAALTNEGYLSDASEIMRGRSPRGRRGSSKPPEDPTDLALLQDIPNWLRTLRLHKYTDQLKDVPWKELVQLDEAGLEAKGVAAKGARSKLLKVSRMQILRKINVFTLCQGGANQLFSLQVFEQVREAQAEGRL